MIWKIWYLCFIFRCHIILNMCLKAVNIARQLISNCNRNAVVVANIANLYGIIYFSCIAQSTMNIATHSSCANYTMFWNDRMTGKYKLFRIFYNPEWGESALKSVKYTADVNARIGMANLSQIIDTYGIDSQNSFDTIYRYRKGKVSIPGISILRFHNWVSRWNMDRNHMLLGFLCNIMFCRP